MIINDLSAKTHEKTGNKPEINNKPNMTINPQHPCSPHPENPKILKILIMTKTTNKCTQPAKTNTIDYQTLTHQNPEKTGNKPEINNKPNMTIYPQHPCNPHPVNPDSEKTTSKCTLPAKTNTIDYQPFTHQNPEITGNKPAKPEMNNKPNINRNHTTHIL